MSTHTHTIVYKDTVLAVVFRPTLLSVPYRHGIRPVYPPRVSRGLNRSRDIPTAAGEGLYASPRVLYNRFGDG